MRFTPSLLLTATVLGSLAAALVSSCSAAEIITSGATGTGGRASTSTSSGTGGTGGAGGGLELPDAGTTGTGGGCMGVGCDPDAGFFCGDGKIDPGEYGKCSAACVLGPRCGDGITQAPQETCDDGNLMPGDGCSSVCAKDSPK